MTQTSSADPTTPQTPSLDAALAPRPVARDQVATEPLSIPTRPWLITVTLLCSDLLMLAIPMALAVYGRWAVAGGYDLARYAQLWPVLGLFVLGYAVAKLYPAVPLAPADELRRLTVVTSMVFLGLATATFLTKEGHAYSRSVLLMSWAMSLVTVPAGRAALRLVLAPRQWWGHAVVVLGYTPAAMRLVHTLQHQPEIGLKPVAVLGESRHDGADVHGVPVIGGLSRARNLGRRLGVSYAIVAMPQLGNERLGPLLERLSSTFHHLIFVPDLAGFSSLWVSGIDLGGTLGLEVRHRLLDPGRRTLKRALDLALIVSTAPLWLPVIGVIALAVKLDSPGPVFYPATRIGMNGKRFRMWKFRSMVRDADRVLEQTLAADPERRAEWEANHKLRDDPRITRVGKWLRQTSLDELPQLWNVLNGEMSLVGPRPILEDGPEKYGDAFGVYKKVLPGLTGMWQVAGRNDLSFEERVHLDVYYVRNWSVWLDLHLLARTTLAVLLRRGAY